MRFFRKSKTTATEAPRRAWLIIRLIPSTNTALALSASLIWAAVWITYIR